MVKRTVEYAPGRQVDIHADLDARSHVLLWHGSGPDKRAVLEPLARQAVSLGLTIYVPDWRSGQCRARAVWYRGISCPAWCGIPLSACHGSPPRGAATVSYRTSVR